MNKERIVLDTNVLLDYPEIITSPDYKFIIPAISLKELDDLKRRKQDLAYSARTAIKTILKNLDIIEIDFTGYEISTNDEKIIEIAKKANQLYTEDALMTVLALKQGISVFNPAEYYNHQDYLGYVEHGISEKEEELLEDFYGETGSKVSIKVDVAEEVVGYVSPSEYLILRHETQEKIYKKVDENTFKRKIIREVKVTDKKSLKPKDIYQQTALVSAMDEDVPMTIIDGPVGSGKTLLALAAALSLINSGKHRNIYVVRPPLGIDSRFDIGFLPGDLSDKMNPWIGGILSNLEFMYGEAQAKEVFDSYFKHFPVNMAQGYSIHESVVIVDEVQLLSINVLKQIISRVAESSKLILLGDEAQTYNIIAKNELGFKKLKSLLPNKDVEYIRLNKVYRGKLAELSLLLS